MKLLLKISSFIDGFNDRMSLIAKWALFVSCIVSALNASFRYLLVGRGFHWIEALYTPYANGFLEVQWYLFAVGVMLAAPHVLRVNEHVRVDVFYGHYSPKTKVNFDLILISFVLLPAVLVILYYVLPMFWRYFQSNEVSPSAGGLVRWPVVLTLPVGFCLIILQALSEIIKRLAWKQNLDSQLSTDYEAPLQ